MTSSRPELRDGLTWLVIFILCFSPSSVESSSNPNVNVLEFCQPWVCSCYMDGVYYEAGDTWKRMGDDCITYRCLPDGSYIPETIGVLFEGGCKYINETWSIGCFQYGVIFDGLRAKFRLLDAGCTAENGDCLQIGDSVIQACDTYECQIDGTCYSLTKTVAGCSSVTHGCKLLHEVWNDHCAVYQCIPDVLGSIIQLHPHDVMLWPRGYYALLKPDTGCPSHIEEKWDEGSRTHYSAQGDNNYYSDPYHMFGNHTEDVLEHYFCTHEDYLRTGFMPIYQTYWDEGRYCILRMNNTCPKNFSEGYIKMVDFAGNYSIGGNVYLDIASSVDGILPDGEYLDNSTLLEFCCRCDGKIDVPLILPTNKPFVLFMSENETNCQEVRAMEWEIEYFSFADVGEGYEREVNGSLPKLLTNDNNTLIYLCHYKPLTCGCVYENGEYVTLGGFYNTNGGCVTYKCVFEATVQKNLLMLQNGGCFDNGGCIPEGSAGSGYTVGESCYDRRCVQKINSGETYFQEYWELENIPIGCRNTGGTCVPLNSTETTSCFESTCQVVNGEPKFVMTSGGCSHNGSCIPVGTNVSSAECVQLQCQEIPEKQTSDMVVILGGCMFNGQCHPPTGVWRSDCIDYICDEIINGTTTTYLARETKLLCSDANGTCHEPGANVTYQCWDYQCFVNGQNRNLVIVGGGCSHLGQCRSSGEIWNENCSNFTCVTFSNSTYFKWGVEYLDPACKLANKSCIAAGTNLTIGCTTYQCRKGGNECGLIAIDGACQSPNGTCVQLNTNFTIDCATYTCIQNDTHIKLDPVVGGCKYGNNCYDVGQRWNESCKEFECVITNDFYTPTMLSKGCKSATEGDCWAKGEQRKMGCHTIQCFVTAHSCRLSVVAAACSYDGKCLEENATRVSIYNKCETVKCLVNWTSAMIKTERVVKSCIYEGKCFGPNQTLNHIQGPFCLNFFCTSNAETQYKGQGCKTENDTCIEQHSNETFNAYIESGGTTYYGANCSCGATLSCGNYSIV